VLYWRPRDLALQMNLQAHRAKSPQGLYPAVRTVGPTPSRLAPPIEIGARGPAASGQTANSIHQADMAQTCLIR